MRASFLFAIGLVFWGFALIGTIYRSILQSPGELRSVVYVAGVASQPPATSTDIPGAIDPSGTPPPGEPTSSPIPYTPTSTRSPMPSPSPSGTNGPFNRLELCVMSESAHYINVRSGPGTSYATLGEPLPVDTCLSFGARNEEATWLQVAPDQFDTSLGQYEGGWIYRELLGLGTTGPIDLPAVTLTPTPVPAHRATITPALVRTDTPSVGLNGKTSPIADVLASRMSLGIPPGQPPEFASDLSSKASQPAYADSSGHYVVEAEWPARIEVKQPGRIRVSLIRTSEGFTPTVELPGSTAVVFTPIPVGTPNQDLEAAFGAGYRPYAAVARVIGVSFRTDPAPVSEPQLLDQSRVDWIWSISSDTPGRQQGIDVTIEIEWRRVGNIQESLKRTVWRNHIEIDIYQRTLSAGQVNIFSLFSAFLGSGLSIPWLYEKLSNRKAQRRKKGKKRT